MSLLKVDEIFDHSTDLVVDSAELIIDQGIPDGILREIPILGTGVRIVKIYVAAKGLILQNSLQRFRYHLGEVTESKKQKFIERLIQDEGYRQKVGENLVLLLHRADDVRKYELIAHIFKALVEEEINDQEFDRLRIAVDRIRMCDLPKLTSFYESGFPQESPKSDTLYQEFVHCGLADVEIVDGMVYGKSVVYKPNHTGGLFVRFAKNRAD